MKASLLSISLLSVLLVGCSDIAITQVETGVLSQQIEVTGELVSSNTEIGRAHV